MRSSKYKSITSKLLNKNEMAKIFDIHEVTNDKEQHLQFNINKGINFKNSDKIIADNLVIYNVCPGDTWQIIAEKTYGDLNLWWVICKFNNISDPTSLPEQGLQLKILRSDFVSNIIQTIAVS